MFDQQRVALLGEAESLEEVCTGVGFEVSDGTLPADCQYRCRTLNYLASTMSACCHHASHARYL